MQSSEASRTCNNHCWWLSSPRPAAGGNSFLTLPRSRMKSPTSETAAMRRMFRRMRKKAFLADTQNDVP